MPGHPPDQDFPGSGALPAVAPPPMELPKPLQNLSRTLYSSPSTPWNLLELPKRHTACQKPPKISPGPLPDSRPGALPAVDSPPMDLPKPLRNVSKTLYNSPSTLWKLLELPKSPTARQKSLKTSPGPLPDPQAWGPARRGLTSNGPPKTSPGHVTSILCEFFRGAVLGSQLCCAAPGLCACAWRTELHTLIRRRSAERRAR